MIEQIKAWVLKNFFSKRDYATASRGAQDAFRPVTLSSNGLLDATILGAPFITAGDLDVTGVITVNGSATWDLGGYNAGAPSATGWVEVTIGGVTYKLLAST